MGRLYATPCKRDKDYARFASYYIEHSHEFDEHYPFQEAIVHLVVSLHESRIHLFDDENGKLQGFIQYRYEADQDTVFIESSIVSPAYRSGYAFYRGFGDWLRQVIEEVKDVRSVRLHVRADHGYLNRLYAKFAKRIGERESNGRLVAVYESACDDLRRYLRLDTL
ncbi:hypothetical protein PCCS19_23500 [Paenibacillus sp. CCS19]|uniref:GNAT family N-acetyltransferase n=1 Tax=Paenibacillus sp. CCS19 TaxID=3158387 RepID=UPI00255F6948|nr:GNAT family N-acetyltransferase [Paenibacillus cellulosilyticus]GMK39296.1 hypothetical protein PCCS19_23500 [Paenibacillus cellulosilyticus]